jgi:hypothetical protein
MPAVRAFAGPFSMSDLQVNPGRLRAETAGLFFPFKPSAGDTDAATIGFRYDFS